MGDTAVPGYVDIWGKHGTWIGDHPGPASYVLGGETITALSHGLRSLDLCVPETVTHSGSYTVEVVSPVGGGSSAQNRILKWYPTSLASGSPTPLTLGTASTAATQSAMSSAGVVTVTGANTLKAGNFVLLTNGASAAGIFLNGAIVQITSATATSYTFNFAAAKALTYSTATDTLKYQIIYGGSTGNPVALGAATGQSIAVTAVAVASNVLTITCANTGTSIVPGNFIVLQGLASGEVPQGAVVQVLTANTTTLTANLIAPNLSATSGETATATVLVTNGNLPIASILSNTITGTTVAATAATASAAGAITVLPVGQTLVAGTLVVIQGLNHGSALNGLITAVLATGLTGSNVETNGYIASAVTTGTADLGALGVLSTGISNGTGEVAAGTNLSGETVRLLLVGG